MLHLLAGCLQGRFFSVINRVGKLPSKYKNVAVSYIYKYVVLSATVATADGYRLRAKRFYFMSASIDH